MVTCSQPLKQQSIRYKDKGARNRIMLPRIGFIALKSPTSFSGISETRIASAVVQGGAVSRVCGADVAVRVARQNPHRTHDLRSGSQDHHPSKNAVQKTICCNETSNAPDDGRMYPKHVELRIH